MLLFLLTDSPQKLKLEKVHGALIIFCYVRPISPPLQSRFKENAKILSKNSITQENIRISRENLLFLLKAKKKRKKLKKNNNHSSASDCWENTKSSFKENAGTFSKNSATQEKKFQD